MFAEKQRPNPLLPARAAREEGRAEDEGRQPRRLEPPAKIVQTSGQTVHESWLGIIITIPRCQEWIVRTSHVMNLRLLVKSYLCILEVMHLMERGHQVMGLQL